jgi:dual oxidase
MWARYLVSFANNLKGNWLDDEFIFNRARQFTIATYQHIVYDEWLPLYVQSKLLRLGRDTIFPYKETPHYSPSFGRSGYNPSINPQVSSIFQSAAMRFGHTMVTPGVWRRTNR